MRKTPQEKRIAGDRNRRITGRGNPPPGEKSKSEASIGERRRKDLGMNEPSARRSMEDWCE